MLLPQIHHRSASEKLNGPYSKAHVLYLPSPSIILLTSGYCPHPLHAKSIWFSALPQVWFQAGLLNQISIYSLNTDNGNVVTMTKLNDQQHTTHISPLPSSHNTQHPTSSNHLPWLHYLLLRTNMHTVKVNTSQQQTQICTKKYDLILLTLQLHIHYAY